MENAAALPKFMLLHFGRVRLIWDWLMLIIVAYIAITVPYNTSFKPQAQATHLYFIGMYLLFRERMKIYRLPKAGFGRNIL